MISRRDAIRAIGLTAAAAGLPRIALGTTDSPGRFVLVVLRGAVDGLALAAPYGDGKYAQLRGELAIPAPGESAGLLKLDGLFGLHPSLQNVHSHYQHGDALVVHAVASAYRERSHFDGQDVLENGANRVGEQRDGWLNRALPPLHSDVTPAIALSQNTPLVLRGDNAVTSWAPSRLPDAEENTIRRLQALYADDEFFATRLEQARRSREIAGVMGDKDRGRRRGNEAQQFHDLMEAAARFLKTPGGPNVAVVELGGWDTHANQGASTGALANRFAILDEGLGKLRVGLDDAWQTTAVAAVTEFGRTVRVNGTRGTDHGTGTAALLLGGAINGGRVIADWPGLRDRELYAGRDLQPTTDIRSVFKGLLIDHLRLSSSLVENEAFPDSQAAPPLENLVKS